jgi:uncharacterized membrane protein YeiB
MSQRYLTLDVFRGLAVVSMLINHTNWAFLPGLVKASTSYLTVTMFAWCLGAGVALSWRRTADQAAPGTSRVTLYAGHVVRALIRTGVLLLLHMALLAVGYRVSVVLGFLSVGLAVAALAAPMGLVGRCVLGAAILVAEPFAHRAWERHVSTRDGETLVGLLGTGQPHVWLTPGEWGNLIFGASSLSANGHQYSGPGVAVMALVGMIAVDNRVIERLPIFRWRHAASGTALAVTAYLVAKAGIHLGWPTQPYAKHPAERILEIAMLVGLWWAAATVCRLWTSESGVRMQAWLATVGAAALSVYALHSWMLTELLASRGFQESAFYATGLFGVAFTALWLSLPVLWNGMASRALRVPAHMAQWSRTPTTSEWAGEGVRASRVIRALTRGPLEALEEALTGLVPRGESRAR